MITMPDGTGVSFVINGAEMTLMGNASITATQNGSMEVSLYSGSATITSGGQTQIVTAGQSTSMDLGGENGTSAISPPSAPEPLSPEELTLACTLTGNFCSQQEITPVSPLDAVATFIAELGLEPSNNNTDGVQTPAFAETPTLMIFPQLTNTNAPALPLNRTVAFTSTTAPFATNTLLPSLTNTPLPPTATNPPPPPPTDIPMITICHCPQADRIGCSTKTVPDDGSYDGHINHQYDIIPAPAGGCP
jgi:hypothetical protein